MNLESLANLGEVVGAAAVVASLLYLAVQVRQSTKAQRTENYARALDRVSSVQNMLSQDSEISRIFAKGVENSSALNTLEKIRFTWALYESGHDRALATVCGCRHPGNKNNAKRA